MQYFRRGIDLPPLKTLFGHHVYGSSAKLTNLCCYSHYEVANQGHFELVHQVRASETPAHVRIHPIVNHAIPFLLPFILSTLYN